MVAVLERENMFVIVFILFVVCGRIEGFNHNVTGILSNLIHTKSDRSLKFLRSLSFSDHGRAVTLIFEFYHLIYQTHIQIMDPVINTLFSLDIGW